MEARIWRRVRCGLWPNGCLLVEGFYLVFWGFGGAFALAGACGLAEASAFAEASADKSADTATRSRNRSFITSFSFQGIVSEDYPEFVIDVIGIFCYRCGLVVPTRRVSVGGQATLSTADFCWGGFSVRRGQRSQSPVGR